MMSLQARRELTASIWTRYQKATRSQKAAILDEFVAATGYSRKYAITLLGKPHPPCRSKTPAKRCRKRHYGPDVERALLVLWKATDSLCSKRLVPFLPALIETLERHGAVTLSPITKEKLLRLSAATCDRLLAKERSGAPRRGLCTTKPGTLLKQQIPVRTYADWNEGQPGFVEVDLVAHCGESSAGEYLYSLTLTDICTGWTECVALPNRGQVATCAAIERARQRLPFALRGLDSDNGSEFLNAHLLSYCQAQQITFTRCRPYHKNDQCHVEQKNWAVVRRWCGYRRLEGEAALGRMERLYALLHLYLNFFQPSVKLVGKERAGAKVKKRYDAAQTPHQRVQLWAGFSEASRATLQEQYELLNPVELLGRLYVLQERLANSATV